MPSGVVPTSARLAACLWPDLKRAVAVMPAERPDRCTGGCCASWCSSHRTRWVSCLRRSAAFPRRCSLRPARLPGTRPHLLPEPAGLAEEPLVLPAPGSASGPVRRGLGWWEAWPDGHVLHRRPPPGGSV